MKELLRYIEDHPIIGICGAVGTGLMGILDTLNQFLGTVAVVVGILVGIYTLRAKRLEWLMKRRKYQEYEDKVLDDERPDDE